MQLRHSWTLLQQIHDETVCKGHSPVSWVLAFSALIFAVMCFALTGRGANLEQCLLPFIVVLTLTSVSLTYTFVRKDVYIASLCSSLALLIFVTILGWPLAFLAMNTTQPLVDASLANWDSLIGVNTQELIFWLSEKPALAYSLIKAYNLSCYAVWLLAIFLVVTKRFGRLNETLALYIMCFLLTIAITRFFPAVGAYEYFSIPQSVLSHFPPHTGKYHLDSFFYARDLTVTNLDFLKAHGIVTFPSFHTSMALLMATALRDVVRLRFLAIAACLLTLFSALVIGGHYLVDIFAGVAVFAFIYALFHCKRIFLFVQQFLDLRFNAPQTSDPQTNE